MPRYHSLKDLGHTSGLQAEDEGSVFSPVYFGGRTLPAQSTPRQVKIVTVQSY